MELAVELAALLRSRKLLDGSIEVLVQWKDLHKCDSTWESWELLCTQFPHLHLEDKVLVENEMTPQLKLLVYSKKEETLR